MSFLVGLLCPPLWALDQAKAQESPQGFFDALHRRVQELENQIKPCSRGQCPEQSEVLWVLSRSSGQSRVVRSLNPRPQWLSEGRYARLMSSIGALPPPHPRLETDAPERMVFKEAQTGEPLLVILEYATGFPTERVLGVLDPRSYFSEFLKPSANSRRWVFLNSGEVLAQSDTHYQGSLFGSHPYFQKLKLAGASQERSFDQLEVMSVRQELPHLGLLAVFETPLPEKSPSGPIFSHFRALHVVLFLFGFALMVPFFRSRKKKGPTANIDRISIPSQDLHQCIYRSRTVEELGVNFSLTLSRATGCEVFFLRYQPESGLASEVGFSPEDAGSEKIQIPLSPLGLVAGQGLPEIPTLRSAVVRNRDHSQFLAWPLLAEGKNCRLFGVFVLLKPTPHVRMSVSSIGVWAERAGRYCQSILSFDNQTTSGRTNL
ncbi:MAG: hypothetical protein KGQ59_07750 [Bdellovibrionales bacterium]|nr:hypothetical protein [Bdellovibrionales bacterium]